MKNSIIQHLLEAAAVVSVISSISIGIVMISWIDRNGVDSLGVNEYLFPTIALALFAFGLIINAIAIRRRLAKKMDTKEDWEEKIAEQGEASDR